MQFNSKLKRLKRAKRNRIRLKQSNKPRLVVTKSNKNIYAQVIVLDTTIGDKVVASASTLDKEIKNSDIKINSNVECAQVIGKLIAKRAQDANVKEISFDRSGYRYHGCVKALADAAREAGLIF